MILVYITNEDFGKQIREEFNMNFHQSKLSCKLTISYIIDKFCKTEYVEK